MATSSRDPSVEPVKTSEERILRDSRPPADAMNLLPDPHMENSLAALHFTSLWQNTATETPEGFVLNVSEEKIENDTDMSEDEYIPATQAVYVTLDT